ncbi:MAG: AmmeMemoRadiSam system protein B [Bacteroidota bacterium]|nr:AmmeMemoRadiSam system protein B [Bacteroidota bacterium]
MEHSEQIDREPAVAGAFYPAEPQVLKALLKEAFDHAKKKSVKDPVIAIVSPHAGYVYSAKVAASAFNQIDTAKHYEHIFVIGSSHHAYFDGASIYTAGDFIMPLGHIKTDPLGRELVKQNPVFNDKTTPHGREHSIEVQLPFLQYLLKDKFTIIPILLGTQSPEVCRKIAQALKPYFNEHNLFVISTDFSHYPDYETAKTVDSAMAEAVVSNSPEKLLAAVRNVEKQHTEDLLTGMCGWPSVLTLMYMSAETAGITVEKIDYQNSGDVAYGDKSRVVGYTALAFEKAKQSATKEIFSLTDQEKQTLLVLARKTIDEYIRNGHVLSVDSKGMTSNLKENCGAFVSLHLHEVLKGCIGTFRTNQPLYENIRDMAIEASTNDSRFDPVTLQEIKSLEIEISVLTPMHKIASINEISIGKHGIYIRKNGKGGTFLPQVAPAQKWTLEEYLGHCSRDKARLGWDGWKNAEIFTYEAIVFSEKDFPQLKH